MTQVGPLKEALYAAVLLWLRKKLIRAHPQNLPVEILDISEELSLSGGVPGYTDPDPVIDVLVTYRTGVGATAMHLELGISLVGLIDELSLQEGLSR